MPYKYSSKIQKYLSKRKKRAPLRTYLVPTRKLRVARPYTSYQQRYPIERSASIICIINESSGFNNAGIYLGMSFCLSGVNWYTVTSGGVVTFQGQAPIPNVSEFQALFDKWKLEKVQVKMIFSNNTSNVSTPTTALPVIYQAIDFDSVQGFNNLNEYPQVRTCQLGSINDGFPTFMLYNPKAIDLIQNINSSNVVSSIQGGTKVSPVLDTAAPDIQHYGMRFQYQNFNDNSNVSVGQVLFQIKLSYCFYNVR